MHSILTRFAIASAGLVLVAAHISARHSHTDPDAAHHPAHAHSHALTAASGSRPAAQALVESGAAILYYEAPRELRLVRDAAGQRKRGENHAGASLRFDAFGRRFDLHLTPNTSLTRAAKAGDGQVLYRGHDPAQPDSWARLAIDGDRISGVIRAGDEMYAIEPAASVGDLLAAGGADAPADGPVVFRLADTLFEYSGLELAASPGAPALQKVTSQPLENGATRRLQVGLISDREYTSDFADTQLVSDAMLARANIVDGIFAEQLGVQIEIVSVTSYGTEPDPFTSSEGVELLEDLAAHKASSDLRTLGLAHLFTGRDLNSNTVGIAYLSTICSARNSVSLTQASSSATRDALIAAHEIGHNFGAPHDNEAGSACADAPRGFLMEAAVNGSDTFSSCSLAQMEPLASNGFCLLPALAASFSLDISGPTQFALGESTTLTLDVTVDAASGVAPFSLDVSVPGELAIESAVLAGGNCTVGAGGLACVHNGLLNGQSAALTLTLRADAAGSTSIDATVAPAGDPGATGDSEAYAITVIPAVDLTLTAEEAIVPLKPGESTVVRLTVQSMLSVPAPDVVLQLDLPQSPELTLTADTSCTPAGDGLTCGLGDLAQGELREVAVTVTADPDALGGANSVMRTVRASIASSLPDIDASADQLDTTVALVDAIVDLGASISASQGSLAVDAEGSFSVSVQNDGEDTAADVLVSVNLSNPAATLTAVTPAQGTCELVSNIDAVCELGELAAGARVAIEVRAQARSAGSVTLAASVSNPSFDSQSGNDAGAQAFSVQSPVSTTPTTPATGTGGGGGGGGAVGLGGLLLLLAPLLRRRIRVEKSRRG